MNDLGVVRRSRQCERVSRDGGCEESSSSSSSSTEGEGGGVSTYKYNRQGQAIEFKDAAGTIHTYSYDELGRQTDDKVTAFGSGIDDTVKRITRSFDDHLRLEKVSSYNAITAGTLQNEAEFGYNGFGQLASDKQKHSASDAGREVAYSYDYGTDPGITNTLRRTGMTYPSSETTTIKYESEAAKKLSRPDILSLGSTEEASYRYLGLGMFVGVDYLGINPSDPVYMTYEVGTVSTSAPGGDKYSGLDAFGRVVETLWKKGSSVKENVGYGYDRASNRNWRRNEFAHTLSNGEEEKHDNFYWYDGLYQVIERRQGNLTGTTGNPYTGIGNTLKDEDWCYDETGNWQGYDYDAAGTSDDVNQTRTHNQANEICAVTGPGGVAQPAYDPVGNQTADIAPGDWTNTYDLKWDAWNRLIEVKDGNDVLQTNAYDGLTRRISSTKDSDTIHYYYNDQWRAVEEYPDLVTTSPNRRYLWGLRSRWDLVKRLRDDAGDLDEERYVLYDAMDPVAICDENGTIKQRFEYSPFGTVSFLDGNFVPEDPPSETWNWLFHGEFRDDDTGYYNYGFRYYNDATGRWVSRDPLGEADGSNRYIVMANRPIVVQDWLGLKMLSLPKPESDTSNTKGWRVRKFKPNFTLVGPVESARSAQASGVDGFTRWIYLNYTTKIDWRVRSSSAFLAG